VSVANYSSVLDLLIKAESIEQRVRSLLDDVLQLYEKAAELLNETLAPEISEKFNVDCKFEAETCPDSCFPKFMAYAIIKKVFDDVDDAYEEENRVWGQIDKYLSENYEDLYKHFSVIVLSRFREEEED